jgi:tetraacyldisaccharide 4'-kinase
MRAPAFWWRKAGIAAALLSPLGALYATAAGARLRRSGARAALPVVCVGDPTVGGGGKTPTAIAVAELLRELGERPVFLSRGYGGHERGPLVVDSKIHGAADVGDEPLLLARVAPTIVAVDRVAGAAFAASTGATVIVMDDGFQNPALQKDVALLVVDAATGLGNGLVLPAGPLRARWKTQLKRAQAVVMVGEDGRGMVQGLPVFGARLVPDPDAAAALQGRRLLAFAGIGRPEKFAATLQSIGVEVAETWSYPDHHRYSAKDVRALLTAAKAADLVLVTTEKDQARIGADPALATLAEAARVLPVRLSFADAAVMKKLLAEALAQRGARAG